MVYLALIRYLINTSLSARRAWIEIHGAHPIGCKCPVALRKESVDRNIKNVLKKETGPVALRKESVDRNDVSLNYKEVLPVALRKESVDRNSYGLYSLVTITPSLSARRAWIEISVL